MQQHDSAPRTTRARGLVATFLLTGAALLGGAGLSCSSGRMTGGTDMSGGGAGDEGGAGNEGGAQSAGQSGQAGESGGPTGGTGAEGGSGGVSPAGGAPGGSSGGAGGSAGTGTGGRPMVMNTAACQPPALRLVRVATASEPMALAQAPNDPRLFVVERAGRIRVLQNGTLSATPFADFRSSVITQAIAGSSERGLLNMALHPRFPADPRFYLFYTRRNNDPHSSGGEGHVVIAEGRQQSATAAMPSLRAISIIPHREDHHIGGFLAFGPDGMLYAGTGDGGGRDDERVGQDPTRKLSKILRIDVDRPDIKPPGNLDLPGADRHTWAYGVRNPYRGSFDRASGDMYFGDVGFSSWEEINWVPPGMSQLNFGWGFDDSKKSPVPGMGSMPHNEQSGMEGLHPMPHYLRHPWQPFGYLPIHEYPHDGPGWRREPNTPEGAGWFCGGNGCAAAVIGGHVYRGADPTLYGRYFYGDYSRNFVKSFIVENGRATCHADHTSQLATGQTPIQGLNGFGEGGDGTLYLHDLAGGNIYRIERR